MGGALGSLFARVFGSDGLIAALCIVGAGVAFLIWFRVKYGHWPDEPAKNAGDKDRGE